MMDIVASKTESSGPSPRVREETPRAAASPEPTTYVDVYLIRTRKLQPVLFMTRQWIDVCASKDGHTGRRLIRKLLMSRRRVIRWLGRAMRSGHREYQKLEDRIDAQERIIKALNCSESFRVWHSEAGDPELVMGSFLRSQAIKHTSWLIVDSIVTALALLLMPIPGPNVMGWYPFLRSVSHYHALKGARRAQRALGGMEFHQLSGLSALDIRFRRASQRETGATGPEIEGLDEFLARMG